MSLPPEESFMNSTPIANWKEFLTANCPHDLIRHDNLVNYSRSLSRLQLYCVMCGRMKGQGCEIPNQNKDICKTCDSLFWKVESLNVVVKFCKGCKNFCLLTLFGDKPMAAKCSKCRQRGREHYHTKKNLDNPSASTTSPSSSFSCTFSTPAPAPIPASTGPTGASPSSLFQSPFQSPSHPNPHSHSHAHAFSEHRNKIFFTPPPVQNSSGRTISPILCSSFQEYSTKLPTSPVRLPSYSTISCDKIYEPTPQFDVSNLPSLLSSPILPVHRPAVSPIKSASANMAAELSSDGFWDPSAHPLLNLAVLSEQMLNPGGGSSLLSPIHIPATTNTSSSSGHKKKRKR